jgi:hypothetical protein
MNHYLFNSVPLIPLMILLAFPFPDQQTQYAIKEFVRVINVEVIVRVSDQGKLVSGLTKSDFRLSENGQAMKINGFSEFHRTMAAATAQVTPAPRLFILYFWLFEPGVDYQQALDFFLRRSIVPMTECCWSHCGGHMKSAAPMKLPHGARS